MSVSQLKTNVRRAIRQRTSKKLNVAMISQGWDKDQTMQTCPGAMDHYLYPYKARIEPWDSISGNNPRLLWSSAMAVDYWETMRACGFSCTIARPSQRHFGRLPWLIVRVMQGKLEVGRPSVLVFDRE